MPTPALLRRALTCATAAVLSAAVFAAVLGSDPVDVEVSLARAVADGPTAAPGGDLAPSAAQIPVALSSPAGTPAAPTPTVPPAAPPVPEVAPAAPPAEPASPAPAPPPPPPAPPAPAPPAAPSPAPAPAAPPPPARVPSTSFARAASCESNMVRWMNEVRAAHGLAPLVLDPGIQWVPVAWSDRMASARRLAHNPDFGAQIFGERPQATSASENVGRTTGTDRSVFDGFMDSPPHREAILSPVSTHTTAGCVHDGSQLWVTVNFWG